MVRKRNSEGLEGRQVRRMLQLHLKKLPFGVVYLTPFLGKGLVNKKKFMES